MLSLRVRMDPVPEAALDLSHETLSHAAKELEVRLCGHAPVRGLRVPPRWILGGDVLFRQRGADGLPGCDAQPWPRASKPKSSPASRWCGRVTVARPWGKKSENPFVNESGSGLLQRELRLTPSSVLPLMFGRDPGCA